MIPAGHQSCSGLLSLQTLAKALSRTVLRTRQLWVRAGLQVCVPPIVTMVVSVSRVIVGMAGTVGLDGESMPRVERHPRPAGDCTPRRLNDFSPTRYQSAPTCIEGCPTHVGNAATCVMDRSTLNTRFGCRRLLRVCFRSAGMRVVDALRIAGTLSRASAGDNPTKRLQSTSARAPLKAARRRWHSAGSARIDHATSSAG